MNTNYVQHQTIFDLPLQVYVPASQSVLFEIHSSAEKKYMLIATNEVDGNAQKQNKNNVIELVKSMITFMSNELKTWNFSPMVTQDFIKRLRKSSCHRLLSIS